MEFCCWGVLFSHRSQVANELRRAVLSMLHVMVTIWLLNAHLICMDADVLDELWTGLDKTRYAIVCVLKFSEQTNGPDKLVAKFFFNENNSTTVLNQHTTATTVSKPKISKRNPNHSNVCMYNNDTFVPIDELLWKISLIVLSISSWHRFSRWLIFRSWLLGNLVAAVFFVFFFNKS